MVNKDGQTLKETFDKEIEAVNIPETEEELEIEDAIDDDTISLEDSESDDQVISDEVDDLDISDSDHENIEEQ